MVEFYVVNEQQRERLKTAQEASPNVEAHYTCPMGRGFVGVLFGNEFTQLVSASNIPPEVDCQFHPGQHNATLSTS